MMTDDRPADVSQFSQKPGEVQLSASNKRHGGNDAQYLGEVKTVWRATWHSEDR